MVKDVDSKPGWTHLIILLMLLAFAGGCDGDNEVVYRDMETVEIGAVVALSEDSPVWGTSCLEALRLAEADVNEVLANRNSDKRVRLIYGDSATDPMVADYLLRSFIGQGARVVIGPLTSSELLAMADTVNASDSVLISPSSTLSQLSVADNIFRMVPDDSHMIEAIVQALSYKGIRHLAVMYIDDTWGASLFDQLSRSFEENGGTVLGSRKYLTLRTDILQAALDDLSSMVADQIAVDGPSGIGFMLIAYDEALGIMELAASDSVLGSINWFGSDGFVKHRSLLENETAASFCVKTQYLAPALEVTLTPEGEILEEEIKTATGGLPATYYSLLAYDAFWAGAQALLNSPDNPSIDSLRDALTAEFENSLPATGTVKLNAAGDQSEGTYYFWTVIDDGASYAWKHELTFEDEAVQLP